jgi:2-polyprenyl-3-methyl-5-hydroxy-6-metoxy-1,4-benzoquinol methylase
MQSFLKKITYWFQSQYSSLNKQTQIKNIEPTMVDSEPKNINVQNELPFTGYEEQRNEIKFIDFLTDEDLQELNNILRWNCFVVDSHGRRFGNQARSNKRNTPQIIPDRRIVLMDEYFNLADKHVLEIGCFEGIHTIGLSQYAKSLTAFDSRIENMVKTIVRCSLFGVQPTIFKFNIEEQELLNQNLDLLSADVMHHVGVLYHLIDPVQHLFDLKKYIRFGLMLDTHYALEQEAKDTYEVNGKTYAYKKYREGGYADVFSGMYESSKWLKLDDIVSILKEVGFDQVDIIEDKNERNGPRVLILAKNTQSNI